MLPGPDLIYECPYCGSLLKRGSLTSGNTFGAKLYSDGKQVAPMLPDFPNLTKCKRCNNIFWIEDLKEIGGYSQRHDSRIDEKFKTDNMRTKWESAEAVEFLGIKDLYTALGIAKDLKEEKTIRIWIWWAFNDRIREDGADMFIQEDDKDLWEENCRVLLDLLNLDDLNEAFMAAELYRNLGEFENCIKTINNIDDKESNWIKDPMKYLAKKKFKQVFILQSLNLPKNKAGLPFFQMRGELREKQGDYQGALDDYDKAIFLDASNPFFYVLKAGVYEQLEDSEMALKNFDKALSINPNFSDAYINRALFFRRNRKNEEAIKDYEKAISLEPRSFEITTFSEVDIFKYGKFGGIFDAEFAETFSTYKAGTLHVDVDFSPKKKTEEDSFLFIDAKKLPYFIFRKKRWKPILNKRFVKFEFTLAKCISYIRVYILGKPVKYVNNAILN